MKKFIAFLVIAALLANFNLAEARSGCCSHHKGVCGCRCCDGTALSATCAPYYPSCGQANVSQTVTKPKVVVPSPAKISEFTRALDDAKSRITAYRQNPHGFREKLVAEMVKKYKTLPLATLGLIVYSTLPDQK